MFNFKGFPTSLMLQKSCTGFFIASLYHWLLRGFCYIQTVVIRQMPHHQVESTRPVDLPQILGWVGLAVCFFKPMKDPINKTRSLLKIHQKYVYLYMYTHNYSICDFFQFISSLYVVNMMYPENDTP